MPKTEQYSPPPPWPRTDYCGAIRATDVGREVALWGWVQTRRDHGGVIFILLLDRGGIVHPVLNPAHDTATHAAAGETRSEFYVAVKGKVVRRAEGTVNAELPPGEIEVLVSAFETLSASAPLPFQIADADATAEEIRLKYRYLDLRRPEMQRNLRWRHQALQAVRSHLDQNGFIDVETFQIDARGRARLPGAEPREPRQILRAAAIAAVVEADSDDRRTRSLLSDSPVFPRESPARIQPDRYRDDVPAARGYPIDCGGNDRVGLSQRARR